MKVNFFTALLFLLIMSCSNSLSEYDKAFNSYMANISPNLVHEPNTKFLYFIDLSACNTCTDKHLITLEKLAKRDDYMFLVVGDTSGYFQSLKAIDAKRIVYDTQREYAYYEVDFGKPAVYKKQPENMFKRMIVIDDFLMEDHKQLLRELNGL